MKDSPGKCIRCGQTMFEAEYAGHRCVIPHLGVRRIEVSQWWESANARGEPLLMALGLDGYIYRLTQVTKKAFVEAPSDESKQEDYRDRFRRRGNSSRARVLSSLSRLLPPFLSCQVSSANPSIQDDIHHRF